MINFTIPEMKEWLENGIKQYNGVSFDCCALKRVKRQTIRKYTPERFDQLIRCTKYAEKGVALTANLWYNQRNHKWYKYPKQKLGDVKLSNVKLIRFRLGLEPDVFSIEERILENNNWHPLRFDTFENIVYKDGFDLVSEFIAYFEDQYQDFYRTTFMVIRW